MVHVIIMIEYDICRGNVPTPRQKPTPCKSVEYADDIPDSQHSIDKRIRWYSDRRPPCKVAAVEELFPKGNMRLMHCDVQVKVSKHMPISSE